MKETIIFDVIIWLLVILSSITALVGIFLCGINVIQCLFNVGGSYEIAMAGFLMATIGGIVTGVLSNSIDKE